METETKQIHNFHAGELFDRHYRLLEHVGSGGFADVWRAKDELVDTIVALKIYTRLDKDGISELAKEYKDMRGIKHPNLLTGNHFDASGNIPYLEMDFCDGGSLYGKMGRMTNEELHHVVHDIASGLAYLHQEGIVHQDIKPENILYDKAHGRYLLSDFGISGKSRTRLSRSVNMANMTLSMTEAYAPPEKFSGNLTDIEPDAKGDIFSLGMTLYELATGQLPFTPPMATGREMLYSHGRLQVDYSIIQDTQLRHIVERCTKYSKEERPTAQEVLAMLESRETEATAGGNPSKPPTEKKKVDGGSPVGNGHDKSHNAGWGNNRNGKPTPKPNRAGMYIVVAVVAVFLAGMLLLPKGKTEYIIPDTVAETAEPEVVQDMVIPDTVAETAEPELVSQKTSSGVRMDGNTLRFTVDGKEYSYKMVYVSGGTYTMGCTSEQGDDCYSFEKPAHSVAVSGFYMGQTEVTQALWKAVMGSNPSNWKGNTLPVENVSYNDCKDFIGKLNSMTGETFRLPTEEEWEYAARGGNSGRGYKYSGNDNIDRVAWYDDNICDKTHPVAQKQANKLGLYDMSGNVWEWCSSLWCDDYNSSRSGSYRVMRGGSWINYAGNCRVSYRYCNEPSIRFNYYGFRLAR